MKNSELIKQLSEYPMDVEVRILHYEPEVYDALDGCIAGGLVHNPKISVVTDNSTDDYKGVVIVSDTYLKDCKSKGW